LEVVAGFCASRHSRRCDGSDGSGQSGDAE
jgi:hypothetical protein